MAFCYSWLNQIECTSICNGLYNDTKIHCQWYYEDNQWLVWDSETLPLLRRTRKCRSSSMGSRRNFCEGGQTPKKAPHKEEKAPHMEKTAPIKRKKVLIRRKKPPYEEKKTSDREKRRPSTWIFFPMGGGGGWGECLILPPPVRTLMSSSDQHTLVFTIIISLAHILRSYDNLPCLWAKGSFCLSSESSIH